jgi:DNA modification methylase
VIDMNLPVISKPSDLWILENHRLLCGDSLNPQSYPLVLDGRKADLVFTDPPYNVPINGHVLTSNKSQHAEFAMASGEMTTAEFQSFLKKMAQNMVDHSKDGSIHFICMDWRHIYDLLHSFNPLYAELKNICVWNKNNGGMGSLYRSKHEMVAVYKSGTGPHTNNVELGKHGRYRTNVWDYAGQTSPHADRADELAMHPTVKPVRMIADAIYDCSHRDDIILDPFGGSGSTLMAAEDSGRKACLIELEPRYVDVTIERWQCATGKTAIHAETGLTFDQMAADRKGVCFVR